MDNLLGFPTHSSDKNKTTPKIVFGNLSELGKRIPHKAIGGPLDGLTVPVSATTRYVNIVSKDDLDADEPEIIYRYLVLDGELHLLKEND